MDKEKILDILELEGISECDDVSYNSKEFIVNAYYIFDKAEIEAAKSFANENYKEVLDDTWYDENYFPYLYDVAGDNINEILEDIGEEENIKYDWILYEMDVKANDKCEVLFVFSKDDIEIEKIIDSIDK